MAKRKTRSIDDRIATLQAIKDRQTKQAELRKQIETSRSELRKLRTAKKR